MDSFKNSIKSIIENFNIVDVFDILLISTIIFIIFNFLIRNNATKLIKILIFTIVAVFIAKAFSFKISGTLGIYILILCLIFIIVLYSSEIKRYIWTTSKKHFHDNSGEMATEEELHVCTDEIVKAVQNMAKRDIGALLVFIEGNTPESIVESGIELNSKISSQLIESIFIPKSPLHDGAVLIKGNKILAAGCFLPLSQEINLSKEYGTRHRAAIGITEQQDVTAIVVSEETGIISVAKDGDIKRYLDGNMLKSSLEKVYGLSGDLRREMGSKLKKSKKLF